MDKSRTPCWCRVLTESFTVKPVRGGTSHNCPPGCGTLFQITPSGTFTKLYSFCLQAKCADGSDPSSIMQHTNGNFMARLSKGESLVQNALAEVVGRYSRLLRREFSKPFTAFAPKHAALMGGNPTGLIQGTNGHLYGNDVVRRYCQIVQRQRLRHHF
jgi:uncharacterized repeat protein (TIGR03803 family)